MQIFISLINASKIKYSSEQLAKLCTQNDVMTFRYALYFINNHNSYKDFKGYSDCFHAKSMKLNAKQVSEYIKVNNQIKTLFDQLKKCQDEAFLETVYTRLNCFSKIFTNILDGEVNKCFNDAKSSYNQKLKQCLDINHCFILDLDQLNPYFTGIDMNYDSNDSLLKQYCLLGDEGFNQTIVDQEL